MRLLPDRLRRLRIWPANGLPAVWFVVGYVGLLFCVPAQLILKPMGAPGTPANGLAIILLLWWLCAMLGGLNPVRGWTPARVSAGLLTLCVLASYANAVAWGWYAPPDVRQVTDELWTIVPPTVDHIQAKMVSAADRGLLSFAGWMGILLVTADGLRSWADLDRVVTWLCRLGTVLALLGIIQFFTGFNPAGLISIPGLSANSDYGIADTRSVLNRVSSTATHAIEFGVVTAALLPLSLHRTIFRWGQRWALLPTVVIGVGCSMSVSRSGVLVAGIGFLVLLAGWPAAWRIRFLVLAPFCAVALRVAVPGLVGTLISLFTNLFVDDSIDGRTGDYGVVLNIYADHPLLGRGLFTFLPRYYRILDNQVLMFLLELGLIGALVALSIYVTGYYSARRVRRHATTYERRHLGLALSASIAGLMLSLVTYDAWAYPMATGLTFLMLGLATAAWRLTNDSDPDTPYAARTLGAPAGLRLATPLEPPPAPAPAAPAVALKATPIATAPVRASAPDPPQVVAKVPVKPKGKKQAPVKKAPAKKAAAKNAAAEKTQARKPPAKGRDGDDD